MAGPTYTSYNSFGTDSNVAAAGRLGVGGALSNAAMQAGGGFGRIALDREQQQLREAQGQAARSQMRVQASGGNPFEAARQSGRMLNQQTQAIQSQTDSQLAQAAEQERQRQEAERLRREQQAQQWLGAGLSAAGSVLGNVLVPGLGGAMGGALGGGLGSALTGGAQAPQQGGILGGLGQQAPRQPPMMPRPTGGMQGAIGELDSALATYDARNGVGGR